MRHNRLKLVVLDDAAKNETDATEFVGGPATPGPSPARLRLVSDDDGPFPDDAA